MNNIPARLARVAATPSAHRVGDRVTLDGKQDGTVSAVRDIGDRTVTPRGSAFVYDVQTGGKEVGYEAVARIPAHTFGVVRVGADPIWWTG